MSLLTGEVVKSLKTRIWKRREEREYLQLINKSYHKFWGCRESIQLRFVNVEAASGRGRRVRIWYHWKSQVMLACPSCWQNSSQLYVCYQLSRLLPVSESQVLVTPSRYRDSARPTTTTTASRNAKKVQLMVYHRLGPTVGKLYIYSCLFYF